MFVVCECQIIIFYLTRNNLRPSMSSPFAAIKFHWELTKSLSDHLWAVHLLQ